MNFQKSRKDLLRYLTQNTILVVTFLILRYSARKISAFSWHYRDYRRSMEALSLVGQSWRDVIRTALHAEAEERIANEARAKEATRCPSCGNTPRDLPPD